MAQDAFKIHSAEFLLAAGEDLQFPKDNIPEIVFAGRSNVGKSSLINAILGRKRLARTSNSPGKTRQIHFYEINHAFRFVDLPGYGYAAVSRGERDHWRHLIDSYFHGRMQCKGVVHLVDIRHPDMQNDLQLSEYLFSMRYSSCLVATKIDKLTKQELNHSLRRMEQIYRINPLAISSTTGQGIERVWKNILQWLKDERQ